jgi:hypothetical protein
VEVKGNLEDELRDVRQELPQLESACIRTKSLANRLLLRSRICMKATACDTAQEARRFAEKRCLVADIIKRDLRTCLLKRLLGETQKQGFVSTDVAEIQTLNKRGFDQVSDFVVVLASQEKSGPMIDASVGGNRCFRHKNRQGTSVLPNEMPPKELGDLLNPFPRQPVNLNPIIVDIGEHQAFGRCAFESTYVVSPSRCHRSLNVNNCQLVLAHGH